MPSIEYEYKESNSGKEKGQSRLGQTEVALFLFLLLVPVGLIVAQNVTEFIDSASLNGSLDGNVTFSVPSLPDATTSTETTTTLFFQPPSGIENATTAAPDTTTTLETTTISETTTTPASTTTSETTTTTSETTVTSETTTTLPSPTLELITPDRITRGREAVFEAVYLGGKRVDFVWSLPEGFREISAQKSCSSGECREKVTVSISPTADLGKAKVRVEAHE